MAQIEGAFATFIAEEVLAPFRRVKLKSSATYAKGVEYADAGEAFIGITQEKAAAIGDAVTCKLVNGPGTFEIEVSETLAINADLYGAADGKVADTASGEKIGVALEAATAATDVIELWLSSNGLAESMTGVGQIPLQNFLKNNLVTELATAGDGTNLGLAAGTHGSASPILKGSDAGGTTATETARVMYPVPADYHSGDLTIQINAGMQVVSDNTATLDVQCFESDKAAGIGSDLCETAATSINSATLAVKSFTIDGDGLAAGDILDIEITTAVTDTGNAAANILALVGDVRVSYTRRA